MNEQIMQEMEKRLDKNLRSLGMLRTAQRSLVLRTFCFMEKPASARELHYAVKKRDITVSSAAVYRTLELLVACSLAAKSDSDDGTIRYACTYSAEPCSHQHLVCKDCGAAIGETQTRARSNGNTKGVTV